MTITNSNLYSESYSKVKSFIEDISGIDPRNRYKKSFIHASMPNVNDKNFNGYPFIILTTNIGETRPSLDIKTSTKIFRIMVSIWSPESTDVDFMTDKIFNALQTEGSLSDFAIISLDSSPFSWDLDRNGKKILFRNINLIARQRI